MPEYAVRGWSGFQHYKTRRPPWIKLHKTLLDDPAFSCLPVESRALAPMVWLIASETDDGSLPGIKEIAWRLRTPADEVGKALEPLIAAGFVTRLRPASTMQAPPDSETLSPRKQEARLEERRGEEEKETEGEERETRAHTRAGSGRILDEIACPSCGRVGFLTQSPGRNGNPPGWWCRNTGGCGFNFPLDHRPILEALTPGARKAIEEQIAKTAPPARTRTESTDDAIAEGIRRAQERGVILGGAA